MGGEGGGGRGKEEKDSSLMLYTQNWGVFFSIRERWNGVMG